MVSISKSSTINPFQNVELKANVNKADFEKKVETALADKVLTKSEFINIKDDLNIKGDLSFEKILEQLPTDAEVATSLRTNEGLAGLQSRSDKAIPELKALLQEQIKTPTFEQPKIKADTFVKQLMGLDNPASVSFESKESPVKLQKDLLGKITDPDLKIEINSLINKFPGNKEVLANLSKVILEHKPPLSASEATDVVSKLSEMMDEKEFSPKVGKPKDLVLSALNDIANPISISQGNKQLSAGVAAQIELANSDPKKYLSVLHKMATGEKSGNISSDLSMIDNKSTKSITDQIMQPSLNKSESVKDVLSKVEYLEPNDNGQTIKGILDRAKPSKDNPIQITIDKDKKLLVNVTGIDTEKGTFTLMNKQGVEKKYPISELNKTVGIFVPKNISDAIDVNSNPLNAEIKDTGTSVFDKKLSDGTSDKDLKAELKDKLPAGSLKTKVLALADKLNDKTAILYLNHLALNRDPALSKTQLSGVVDKLNQMMTGAEYDKSKTSKLDLVTAAIHDIAAPEDISQNDIGTCAGASVQIELALKDPEKYLSMLDTLAKGENFKTNDAEIPPNLTFMDEGKNGALNTKRTISSKIMQNAIMDFGDGDRKFDSSSNDEKINGGMGDEGTKKLSNAFYGTKSEAYDNSNYSPAQLISMLKDAKPSKTNPVQIDVNYTNQGRDAQHAVVLVGLDEKNATIINPWGREETFPVKVLQDKIYGIITDKPVNSEKLNDLDLNKILNTPKTSNVSEVAKTINAKGDTFIDNLTMKQKVKIISTLSSKDSSVDDKKAAVKIINNMLQGNDKQDNNILYTLTQTFKAEKISIRDVMSNIKTDDPAFYKAMGEMSLIFPAHLAGSVKEMINDPATGSKLLKELDVNQKSQLFNDIAKTSTGTTGPVAAMSLNVISKDIANDKDFNINTFLKTVKPNAQSYILNGNSEAGRNLLANSTDEQKVQILNVISESQNDSKTTPDDKAKLQDATLSFTQNLLKGKTPNQQKEILQKIALPLGRENNFFKNDATAISDGLNALKELLPANNPDASKIISISGLQSNTTANVSGAAATVSDEEMLNLYNNPLGAEINDTGVSKFKAILANNDITPAALKEELLGELKGDNKVKAKALLDKLGDSKEAVLYLNHLMTSREPALNEKQKTGVLKNLTEMMETSVGGVGSNKYNPAITDKNALITAALHDIAAPEDISQSSIATCAGTSVQIELALKDPEKYVKMLHTLAKGETFSNIPPNFTFVDEGKEGKTNSGRTISAKIMQNAIMDYGDDNRRAFDSSNIAHNTGMTDNESKRAKDTIFGTKAVVYDGADYSPKQMLDILDKSAPSKSNPIQISMSYANAGRDSNHAVDLIGIDKTKNTATIINPWGREETFPIKVLQDRLYGIISTANIPSVKLSTEQFTAMLNTPKTGGVSEAAKLINTQGNNFIDSLTLQQKAKVISTLVADGDKGNVLKVLDNMLQGSEVQDGIYANRIFPELQNSGVTLFPDLLNSLKMDTPAFYKVAADLATAAPATAIAASLINDSGYGQKFLDSIDMSKKTSLINNMTANYPTYVTTQDADRAITSLLDSAKKDSGFDMNKFIMNSQPKVKVFLGTLNNGVTNNILSSANLAQKLEIFRSASSALFNPATTDTEKAWTQKGSLALVKNMLDGKDSQGQKEVIKQLELMAGGGVGKPEADSLRDGKTLLLRILPDITKLGDF